MYKGDFGFGNCNNCKSWHWGIELDDDLNTIQFKCCRCGAMVPFKKYKRVVIKDGKKK